MFGVKVSVERREHAMTITIEESPEKAQARREAAEALRTFVTKMDEAGLLPGAQLLRNIDARFRRPNPAPETP